MGGGRWAAVQKVPKLLTLGVCTRWWRSLRKQREAERVRDQVFLGGFPRVDGGDCPGEGGPVDIGGTGCGPSRAPLAGLSQGGVEKKLINRGSIRLDHACFSFFFCFLNFFFSSLLSHSLCQAHAAKQNAARSPPSSRVLRCVEVCVSVRSGYRSTDKSVETMLGEWGGGNRPAVSVGPWVSPCSQGEPPAAR